MAYQNMEGVYLSTYHVDNEADLNSVSGPSVRGGYLEKKGISPDSEKMESPFYDTYRRRKRYEVSFVRSFRDETAGG